MKPEGTYFIRGLKFWDRSIDLLYPEISVSLQKDGYTKPLWRFGYVIEIKPGGIIAAFDRDVTSKIEYGRKVFAPWTNREWRRYDDLEELMKNTREGSHNELWVDSDLAEIVGGYVVGDGMKRFKRIMGENGYEVRRIDSYCSEP
jgi:hypothetical protein